MTIESTTSRITATGTGSTATFPYTFKILDDDQLQVTVKLISTQVETTLTKTTDYTVTGVGVAAGGNVVLVDADQAWLDGSGFLLSTYSITIRRVMEFTQATSITSQSSYLPELHEKQMDRHTMTDLELRDEVNRALQLPITEAGTSANTTIPDATTRASKALGFDASGNPVALTLTSVGVDATSTALVTIGNSGSLGAERALTGTANQITVTDNGANSTAVLSTPQNIHTAATPTFAGLTNSALTAGRVTIAGTSGVLEDDGGLTYDKATDILTVAGAVKTTPAAAPGTLANGQQWSDSARIAPSYRTGGMTEYGSRVVYSQVSDVTVANTTTNTTIMTTPTFGTNTFAANYLTAGKMVKFTAWGTYGITATPTLDLRLWLTSPTTTTLVTCTVTTAANSFWRGEFIMQITDATNVSCAGTFYGNADSGGGNHFDITSVQNGTVDTTQAQVYGLSVVWGAASASNTITCRGVTIEVIG